VRPARRPVEAVYAVGSMKGPEEAIVSYKYGGDRRGPDLREGSCTASVAGTHMVRRSFAVICPVPAFSAGRPPVWGHVELMCAELARSAEGEWPVQSLGRQGLRTEPMSAKGRPQRRQIARQLARGIRV